jgi:hypothetical protein
MKPSQAVYTSVDSDYLLTRVLTHEYLFFDTFWHSSLLDSICLYQQYSSESSINFLMLDSLKTHLGITQVFKKNPS